MSLAKRYDFGQHEPYWQKRWEHEKTYRFDSKSERSIFSIDTPPPTVSGSLHVGHIFSYAHADFMARFWRMRGYNVFYPMGFDDNGLPTERLVEQTHQVLGASMDRADFAALCLQTLAQKETEFERLFKRLGLSVDWSLLYSTIGSKAQRISQASFLGLHRQGRIYRKNAPMMWCPQCETAIAQAETEDLIETSQFLDLAFELDGGGKFLISTTRPELLPACVAVFVHPEDARYQALIGQRAKTPLFDMSVPILADDQVDTEMGSGAVMCCTFGDAIDVAWWQQHQLPLRSVVTSNGRLNDLAGSYAGMTLLEARAAIIEDLAATGALREKRKIRHAVNTHERCGTPLEFSTSQQWFVRVLDLKDQFIELGNQIEWYPQFMQKRFEQWVRNLSWDWCISRQRFFGVPFPLWHCRGCEEILLAQASDLPLDPIDQIPDHPCQCGALDWRAESDVMDTWATSSLTPQLNAALCKSDYLNEKLSPMSLRTQAHEIIRTWAFYTIVKSYLHDGKPPWKQIVLSGLVMNPDRQKLSKSKGDGPIDPMMLLETKSADAIRYWASSARPGRDTAFSEQVVVDGQKLMTKLWNAVRFALLHLDDFDPDSDVTLLIMDRWLLDKLAQAIQTATTQFERFEYAAARALSERFFRHDFCDNYLEIVKRRLYQPQISGERTAAQYGLYHGLLSVLKLLTPIMPFVSETLYQAFPQRGKKASIHRASWPQALANWIDSEARKQGEVAIRLIQKVRKEKTEQGLSQGAAIETIEIACSTAIRCCLDDALSDIQDASRAESITFVEQAESANKEDETFTLTIS